MIKVKRLHIYSLAISLLLIAVVVAQVNDSVIINTTGRIADQLDVDSNLWVAAVPISSGQIGLSWRYIADPIIVGYNVYRSILSGTAYIKINSDPVTTTSYVDVALINGQTYFYVVKVVFSNGTESFGSREVIATATSTASSLYVYGTIGDSDHPAFNDATYDSRTGPRYYLASVAVGDLNGDGLVDFVTHQKGEATKMVAFLHDGTWLWDVPFYMWNQAHNARVVVGDVDGDGVGEVISLGLNQGYVDNDVGYVPVYLQVRNGLTGIIKQEMTFPSVYAGRGNVALVDLNGNGKRDQIVVALGIYHNKNPYVGAYHGNLGLIWEFTQAVGQGHSIKVEDIDEDGRDEILLGGNTFLDHDGSRIEVDNPNDKGYNGPYGHVDGIAVGDIDWTNPGLEVVFAGCDGEHVWMVNSHGQLMWDHHTGHSHWASVGDFDPTYNGLEAFVAFTPPGGTGRNEYIFYADGTYKQVSRYCNTQPMMDWDGDWTNGDELHNILNYADVRITNAYTGQTFLSAGRSSGNRGVDVIGDYRDELLWPDCANRRLVIFSNADYNGNQPLPSKWDDYWRAESKYKRSFVSDYINSALVY